MATSVELIVADNAEQRRYEAHLGSEVVGFISYRLDSGRMTLIHTEVAQALEGQGITSQLVAGALDGEAVSDQMDHSPPGPAFTLDDLVTFHFLLMDEAYIAEFLEGRLPNRHAS